MASVLNYTRESAKLLDLVDSLADTKIAYDKIHTCNASEPTTSCVQRFVSKFGSLLYRHPLADAEVTTIVSDSLKDSPTSAIALKSATKRLVFSPKFLYRIETLNGSATTAIRSLNLYSLSAALSSFLWRSLPDQKLLDAVKNGEFETAQGYQAQINRMMDDKKFTKFSDPFSKKMFAIKDSESNEKSGPIATFTTKIFQKS